MTEIHFETQGEQRALRGFAPTIALHLLRDAIDDIADHIGDAARELAPQGDTGALKAHPFDRSETHFGFATAAPLFGGGTAVRGEGGRFTQGEGGATPGRAVAHVVFTLPRTPKHAVWVHNGTGLFGEHHSPIVPRTKPYMTFYIGTRKFVRRSVRGQKPQPYLTEAYAFIDATYVPIRFERLKAEIDAAYR